MAGKGPAWLEVWGRAPASGRWPVLFRFPGACGMRDYFGAGLQRLGSPASHLLFMAETALHADVEGARSFGTFAVREPGRVGAVRTDRPGIWVGVNAGVAEVGPVQWIPPSVIRAGAIRTWLRAPQVDAAEREATVRGVHAYLEEISVLRAAGAPPPERTWAEVPHAARRRIVAAAGIAPRWTGVLDEATTLARPA